MLFGGLSPALIVTDLTLVMAVLIECFFNEHNNNIWR